MQIAIELIAEEELHIPTDEELKEKIKDAFDSEKLVLECLEPYRDKITEMNWQLPPIQV